MKKPAKMRPVEAWALVYRIGGEIRGVTQPKMFCTRSAARATMDEVHERNGPICRIARVIITEIDR